MGCLFSKYETVAPAQMDKEPTAQPVPQPEAALTAQQDAATAAARDALDLAGVDADEFPMVALEAAIAAYSEAICLAPSPVYHTNRAMCYRKKEDWAAVVRDCTSASSAARCSKRAG